MIDFDRLVLKPAMDRFARPIVVTPLKSQPGQPAYPARGVWAIQQRDAMLEDGGVLAVDNFQVGVRGSEFAVPPIKGDRVEIPAHGSLPAIGPCLIDDDGADGQGGFTWTLKLIDP